jgi:uncharacterized spore protein YtfJ
MEGTQLEGLVNGVRDMITVKRVYGDPFEKNGLTVIPAAAVRGGGGGGEGRRGEGETGTGGGFGVTARPVGAWIIEDGKVTWKPAVDVNKVILGGQTVALVAILVVGRVLGERTGHQRHLLTASRVLGLMAVMRRARPSRAGSSGRSFVGSMAKRRARL